MKKNIVAILLVSSLTQLHAEDSGLPTGPLLSRAEIPSQWVITTQPLNPEGGGNASSVGGANPPSSTSPAKTVKPQVKTVVKNERLTLEKTVSDTGVVVETYILSGMAVTGVNQSNWVVCPIAGTTFHTTDYAKTDFAGLNWISLNNFSGRAKVMGKPCLIFKDKVLTMEPQEVAMLKHLAGTQAFNADSLKVDVEADIDEKTRLPVRLTYKEGSGVMSRTFSFQAPEGSIEMPTEAARLLKKTLEYQKRLSVPNAPI